MKVIRMVVKGAVAVFAVLFIVMGLRWLVDPTGVSEEFGFALADGLGRSSQVGDFGAFFLTLGSCILIAVVSGQRLWFYPAAMLLLIASVGRVLAWILHDAALAVDMIAVEVVVGCLLLLIARWSPETNPATGR